MRRSLQAAAVALASVAATAALTAGHAPSSLQDPLTFRAGVQYVEVDVTVADRKGRLVRTLTKDDFELLEDGVSQTIEGFQLVDIPLPPRPQKTPRGVPQPPHVDRDVASNTGSGRVYVMLLESPPGVPFGHTYLTQRVARWFVEQALGPDDLMAIFHVQGNFKAAQTFTGNRQLLLTSIDRLGLSNWGEHDATPASEQALASLATYDTMKVVAERLGTIGNRRKAILWVGGVANFFPADAAEAVAYREAMRAANRNNVAIYPIDPEGLTIALGRRELERTGALRAVAEDTGGDAIVNTNNFAGGYQRIVEQNSTYYVLGYSPSMERSDGRFHDIKVRVKTPGLIVRARKGYVAPTLEARVAAGRAMPAALSEAAVDGLGSMVPVSGLAIDLFLAPFKGEGATSSVLLGAQLAGTGLQLDADDRIEVSHLSIDTSGRTHPGMRRLFTLNLGAATRTDVAGRGFRYFDRLDLPPGRHEVRLVVHQPRGATGSVIAHVDVPDFTKAPLAMSGVVLASLNDAGRRTLRGDDTAARELASTPTLNRRFTSGDVLSVWGEVYDNRKTGGVIRLTSRITFAAGGAALVTRERLLTTPSGDNARGRLAYQERFEMTRLAPGDCVLTIEARGIDGKQVVTRQVPFAVVEGE